MRNASWLKWPDKAQTRMHIIINSITIAPSSCVLRNLYGINKVVLERKIIVSYIICFFFNFESLMVVIVVIFVIYINML